MAVKHKTQNLSEKVVCLCGWVREEGTCWGMEKEGAGKDTALLMSA